MKITILYNVTKALTYGMKEDLQTMDLTSDVKAIHKALVKEGFIVDDFEINEKNTNELLLHQTDVFFNLSYGIGSLPNSEWEVPKLLEQTKIPYTGSSAKAMILTTDKAKTKMLLHKKHIPTPNFQVVKSAKFNLKKSLLFPLITKPQKEDSSCGIQQSSVVNNINELRKQVKIILKTYQQPVLIEEYIDGRELRISILGNGKKVRVLPITEISFKGSYKSKWRIVDFSAKWDHDADKDTPAAQAKLDKKLYKKIEKLSLKAYNLCSCRDYADIDIRLAKNDTPYFIEINCNPGIAPTDGTSRLAKAAGLTYGKYLKEIVLSAYSRKQKVY